MIKATTAYIIITGTILFLLIWIVSNSIQTLGNEIQDKGLKNIVEEIWEGKK